MWSRSRKSNKYFFWSRSRSFETFGIGVGTFWNIGSRSWTFSNRLRSPGSNRHSLLRTKIYPISCNLMIHWNWVNPIKLLEKSATSSIRVRMGGDCFHGHWIHQIFKIGVHGIIEKGVILNMPGFSKLSVDLNTQMKKWKCCYGRDEKKLKVGMY